MDLSAIQSVVVKATEVALILAAPFLVISLVAGVLISLLQAVTQVNEQTLTFVPKLLIIMLMFILLFPWAVNTMGAYMYDLYSIIPDIKP